LISVSGEGEVFAVPDTAQFTFTVFEIAATVNVAQEVVTETQNKIIDFLKGEGISEENIKTVGYNIYPRYEYQRSAIPLGAPSGVEPVYYPEGRQVIVGYEVRHTIKVKVKETERAGELISGVTSLGANEVSGVSFTIEDEEAIKREARTKAIEDAKEKAEQLVKDLGVRLGPLVRFEESSGDYPIYFERSFALEEGFGGDDVSAPQIPAGENRIVIRVNLGYEIR
jgi:hypothetical protein